MPHNQLFNLIRMKNIMYFLLIIASTFGLFGCTSKTEDPAPANSSGSDTMTCTINGKAWKASSILAGIEKTLDAVVFTGTQNSDNSQIGMLFDTELLKAGKTIPLDESLFGGVNLQLRAYYKDSKAKSYIPFSGSINITSASSTTAQGTFSFKAYDNKNKSDIITITDGKFDLKLAQ